MAYNRDTNIKTFLATIVFIIVILAFCIAGILLFGGEAVDKEDAYPWIVSDSAAINGMLDGSFYNGEKNSAGVLSYKIGESITVGSDGYGDFKIENSGKNVCLMKVKILVEGEVVYETGYIKPNQHIAKDTLDKIPEVGSYTAEAYFEGFDPHSEESIGATKTELTLTVIP